VTATATRDSYLLSHLRSDQRAATLEEHLRNLGSVPRLGLDELEASGLTGRGGGAFPVAAKLRAVAARRGTPVVVCNGSEGEPASEKDKAVMRLLPHLVLDGAVAAGRVLDADKIIVAIAEAARRELTSLEVAIAERTHTGLDRMELTVATVPNRFVAGEETALLQALRGRPARPTTKPPYPFERGIANQPTLVQNVETLARIGLIARNGAGWHGARTALVTLDGAAARHGVHEIELGSTVEDALGRLGGIAEPVSAYLVGGYFGRWIPAAQAAIVELDPQTLAGGTVIPYPSAACALEECAAVIRYLAGEGAGQCGPCTHGLAAIADAFTAAVRGDRAGSDRVADVRRWGTMVSGRGACRHPDGAARFATSALNAFGEELERHLRYGRCGRERRRVLPIPHENGVA